MKAMTYYGVAGLILMLFCQMQNAMAYFEFCMAWCLTNVCADVIDQQFCRGMCESDYCRNEKVCRELWSEMISQQNK